MAVAIIRTDNWLQHLVFTGGRRQTPFGPVDGMFYGLLSGTGDSGGGNFTLNGLLSFDRKEDWVYVIGGSGIQFNAATSGVDGFEVVNTGPLIPTDSAVVNPSFARGAGMTAIVNNAIAVSPGQTGPYPYLGMPVFGDKRISGSFGMYAAGFETNIDTVVYTAAIWGWIIEYSGFFRNTPPAFG